MKQVIDGLLYNTETAHTIGNYYNNKTYSDFDCIDETLYKTKKGRYFIHHDNGVRCGGEYIEPVSVEEAKEWLEAHCDADEYLDEFPAEEA